MALSFRLSVRLLVEIMCRPRSSLHYSSVIPGKLAIASATRNPEKSRTWMPLSPARRREDLRLVLRTSGPGH